MTQETQETVLSQLNHFQAISKDVKRGDEAYWAIQHTIDRLIARLTIVYSVDPVLNPRTNTWEV